MDVATTERGGNTPFNFALIPTHKAETLLEHVRSAVSRGLPEVKECRAHGQSLSIAGGGPSLADTWKELEGFIASANGSLSYLLSKGVTPNLCGVCDPSAHMVDVVEAHPEVTYFLASCAHPSVFDKLLKAGCRVYLWHLHPIDGLDELLSEISPKGSIQVTGGCTMGLRWINLGYLNGFRKFHLHGLDSSFRDKASHAYPDHQDQKEWITFDGHPTRVNFLGQVVDFIKMMDDMEGPDVEPIEIKMFGEGLLQKRYCDWQKEREGPEFVWPATDRMGKVWIAREARNIPKLLQNLSRFGTAVQAGGCVGLFPVHLSRHFKRVHTFEPDPDNFACLVENIKRGGNIAAHHAALGAGSGAVRTETHEEGNAGAVHIVAGGEIPMRTIDDLALDECDLIWLDIEGHEEEALKGAVLTIDRFRPAVIIEEKNHAASLHGLDPTGARAFLMGRRYKPADKVGNDSVFLPC